MGNLRYLVWFASLEEVQKNSFYRNSIVQSLHYSWWILLATRVCYFFLLIWTNWVLKFFGICFPWTSFFSDGSVHTPSEQYFTWQTMENKSRLILTNKVNILIHKDTAELFSDILWCFPILEQSAPAWRVSFLKLYVSIAAFFAPAQY